MAHVTIEQIANLVLGLSPEQEAEALRRHIDDGCKRCGRLFAALTRLREVGEFDSRHRPPDGVVRTVKALVEFGRRRPRQRKLEMKLSLDSMLQPAPYGTRSLQTSNRHLVYYSQNFALDLRMDFESAAREMVLVGQLLNRDLGPLQDVPALLISGDQVLSHSTTGRLGEFHMECRPRGSMQLRLQVNEEELIEVQLDRRRQGSARPSLRLLDELEHPPANSLTAANASATPSSKEPHE